ncbi:uncharacterized protein A1O9_01812 [Exophiala aquamarina CBS 119918]|uniref:protoporphyrinogen oxidase n=1 Tax=Exophiala aquamarina CBS 119918 TaxID=1182545 RepID=A0A072PUU4_9EURO|nr:uncharacterized protein A1O9_01812 [Exophiala aquamarina CBS 119918]KEF63834.1 hypothetical protein A1O9_01812 [Exophiala aquamarina CBS 119918]
MHLVGRTAAQNNAVRSSLWARFARVHCGRNAVFFSTSPASNSGSELPKLRSVPNQLVREIAILGGGITGLSTAHNISKCLPNAKVTIYESSNRLGGWLNSELVQVDDGEVLFEWGPRTLRPDLGGSGMATLDLLADLNLLEHLIPTDKNKPAALNRYIYYPDHLARMPGASGLLELLRRLYSLLFEPIFAGAVREVTRELTAPPRDDALEDESVGDFLQRRWGKVIADNFASAIFHGIYAGDIYKLSARTLLPAAWFLEKNDSSSASISLEIADMMLKGFKLYPQKNRDFATMRSAMQSLEPSRPKAGALAAVMSNLSVYTFEKGLGDLASKLENSLNCNPNVTIHKESRAVSVTSAKNNHKLTVHIEHDTKSGQFDYVVSSLPPNSVRSFLEQSAQSRGSSASQNVLAACKHSDRSVNVMVVNLYYSNPNLIPPEHTGFGYLIPRSVPFDQNPERALGVIFGSETSGIPGYVEKRRVTRSLINETLEQLESEREKAHRQYEMFTYLKDEPNESREKNEMALKTTLKHIDERIMDTKRTEEKWFGSDSTKDAIELEIKMGQDSAPGTKLTVMLGGHWWDSWAKDDLPDEKEAITMATTLLRRHLNITGEPQIAKARLAENCIPQYPVGYRKDMARIHEGLLSEYEGRFKVAGPWWQGKVGVSDCIRKGRETAWAIQQQLDDKTGLEEYTEDESWCILHTRTGENVTVGGDSSPSSKHLL